MSDTITLPDLSAGLRRMLDLSLAHIHPNDARIFGALGNMTPRTRTHDYGLIVFVSAYHEPEVSEAMRAEGVSEEFIAIYEWAAAQGGDLMLINFDRDAEIIPGLKTFY